MSNISEFELDEIVLKISECFHAPMADDGMSAVEGDGNKIKDILRSLLQGQVKAKVTREELNSLYKNLEICVGTRKDKDGTIAYLSLEALFRLENWLKSIGVDVRNK